jgi:hypothetical protein
LHVLVVVSDVFLVAFVNEIFQLVFILIPDIVIIKFIRIGMNQISSVIFTILIRNGFKQVRKVRPGFLRNLRFLLFRYFIGV